MAEHVLSDFPAKSDVVIDIPPSSRRRLRPVRITARDSMDSSPEQPRQPKEPRTDHRHGDAMDGARGDLMLLARDLEEEIDEEQRRTDQGMNIMAISAINSVDVSEVFSPP